MQRLGTKKVHFTGSNKWLDRIVWKDEASGKYFTQWYGMMIEVVQVDNLEGVTAGWKTVNPF